ncbi:MAG: hypothetical protein L0211_20515 [Planctomycetaceae bacterium]|nr:hypothetical protein [Planctomycetaceae bacterium]
MIDPAAAADFPTAARRAARLSIAAAFVSCTLTCVFSQLASRWRDALANYGWLVDWSSLAIVLAGVVLGAIGLAAGFFKRSFDTAAIAAIGLVLNLGIIFVIVWYFAFIRPAAAGP